ncbi:MAG: acyl-CoA thioesterase [Prevotellaceae bacterium]|jgi:acyl-CoA thioester hydrolase|nr:acyl-CoA thioesterase [Prevotellaceae bacterium]MDR2938045.1 acyl-CoA thioesterase [Prevotellaceae bacterium]
MITTPIQIRFSDIDGMGHVNNSVYWNYFDLGRVEYLQQALGDDFEARDETVVLVHVEADYKIQTKLKDSIAVRTRVVGIGERSIKMRQEVVDTTNGEVRVSSYSVLSGFSKRTQQSVLIKPEWREKMVVEE